MDRKPKAGGAKGKTTDPEQSARFIEAAREAGVNESDEEFEAAFRKVAAPAGSRATGRREGARGPRKPPPVESR